jgi:hypothetical protein
MVSVAPYKQWPDIPRAPLLTKIGEITSNIVHSDSTEAPPGFTRDADVWTEASIPTG